MRRLGWFLAACLLLLPAATAATGEVPAAEKAAEVFESLYGKQVRQVVASAEPQAAALLLEGLSLFDAGRAPTVSRAAAERHAGDQTWGPGPAAR